MQFDGIDTLPRGDSCCIRHSPVIFTRHVVTSFDIFSNLCKCILATMPPSCTRLICFPPLLLYLWLCYCSIAKDKKNWARIFGPLLAYSHEFALLPTFSSPDFCRLRFAHVSAHVNQDEWKTTHSVAVQFELCVHHDIKRQGTDFLVF